MLWNVKVKGEPNGKAELYVNGEKVDCLIGYKIEQNGYDKRVPVLDLKVWCEVEIDTGLICPVPQPWADFYNPKDGMDIYHPSRMEIKPE